MRLGRLRGCTSLSAIQRTLHNTHRTQTPDEYHLLEQHNVGAHLIT
jgi:hypothetical protein